MFDIDALIEDCRQALHSSDVPNAIRGIVERAVAQPADVLAVLRKHPPGLHAMYRSDRLTVLNVVWAPHMTIDAHDHAMWTVIGLYAGAEQNCFWRPDPQGRLQAIGAATLRPGDVRLLGRDVIHSVDNPGDRLAGALHVYGGDFFSPIGRSEWDMHGLHQTAWEPSRATRRFEDASRNATLSW